MSTHTEAENQPPRTPSDAVSGREFEATIPLRWGDMDARQHLNNSLYFRLMEEGRIQAFGRMGVAGFSSQGLILASIGCDFMRPLTYPCTAQVTHQVKRIGRTSLEMEVRIGSTDDPGELYARGREVLVWVDYDTGKSAPWPADVIAQLSGE